MFATGRVSRDPDLLLAEAERDSLSACRRPTRLLVRLSAETGRTFEARRRFAEWNALTPKDPRLEERQDYCLGVIPLAEGQLDAAAAAFLRWHEAPFTSDVHLFNRGLVEAASALDRLGYADTAIALFEQGLRVATPNGDYCEASWHPLVLRRLGELHASLGHRDEAKRYYSEFIDLWKDADPELQPQGGRRGRHCCGWLGSGVEPATATPHACRSRCIQAYRPTALLGLALSRNAHLRPG